MCVFALLYRLIQGRFSYLQCFYVPNLTSACLRQAKKGWYKTMTTRTSKIHTLVECALMVALSTILSYIQIFKLPHGGSITLVSMLPIILVSFRHGPAWSMLTAFVFSLIQLLQGIQDVTYCQGIVAIVGCILLDFILAFTVLGLAGIIAKPIKNRLAGVCIGTFAVCFLRYLCSLFSGYIVWKDYDYAFEWMTNFGWGERIANMGENALCWLYSAVYNATYMLPEAILTTIAAVIIFKALPKFFSAQK